MVKIGRNESCPCGSGLKFKKCCIDTGLDSKIEKSSEYLIERVKNQMDKNSKNESLCFRNLKSVEKLSAIIIDFAKPYLKGANTFKEQSNVLEFALVAWNLSLMPDPNLELEKFCEQIFQSMGVSRDSEFKEFMVSMIYRKIEQFKEVKRLVTDYDIIDTGHGFHLNVVSRLLNGDFQEENFKIEAEKLKESNQTTF